MRTLFQPYVGITGFMDPQEVAALCNVLPKSGALSRRLMVGVLVSSKTLAGLPNKFPKQFPLVPAIPSIFPNDSRCLNLLHYSTDHQDTLADQLWELVEDSGVYLDGFQLNVFWPDVQQLRRFFAQQDDARVMPLRLVLQLGRDALAACDCDPVCVADRLAEYERCITDILIDPSGGKGQPFDVVRAQEYLAAIQEMMPGLGLGVAGGLGPSSIGRVAPLVQRFPALSFDAQGQLRTELPDGDLDLEKAASYLFQAYTLVSQL